MCGSLGVGLLLCELCEHDGVRVLEVLLLGGTRLLAGKHESLTLQPLWRDETLDGWSLEGILLAFTRDLSLHHVLSDVVVFGQVKELSDLGGTLDTESTWVGGVCEARDFARTLLDNDKRDDGEVRVDDAATDGLSLTFTGPSWTVARGALGHQQGDTGVGQDTLLHWETLLVVTARDSDNVASPFVTQTVGAELGREPLVEERTKQQVIVDVERLLGPVSRVRNVEFCGEREEDRRGGNVLRGRGEAMVRE